MTYVEDADGLLVDGAQASEMRRRAREIWNHFATAGTAPATWGKLDLPRLQFYRREMAAQFSELRLCEGDWKADRQLPRMVPEPHQKWWQFKICQEGKIRRDRCR
jgi:hypothetical protein